MGKESSCRICEKKNSPNFANLFDSKVKVYECENYMISYFEAMQQLTGMEIDYGKNVSTNICLDCQNRIKLAYKIRGELIKALDRKTKTKIQVIITKSDGNDSKTKDGLIVHEELVEITEVDEDFTVDGEHSEHIYVDQHVDQHIYIHTKERPYKCSMCPKTYNQYSALKVHIRSHTNEKNYICTTCQKGFTNSSDLNKHMLVHDASLKIKCDHCDKTFAQRVNLKNHNLRHHSDNNTNKRSKKNEN